MKIKSYPKVMTIAGSDSGGGAGIQADLKTIAALGCYGTSVITAITAQNTLGVTDIYPLPVDIIINQADAVLSDIGTDALKIGMLHSDKIIKAVGQIIKKYSIHHVVLDPVMVATSGDRLIEVKSDILRDELFSAAFIITPNLPEAEILLNTKIKNVDDMIRAAKDLLQYGSQAVLLKGGHLNSDIIYDVYVDSIFHNLQIFKNKKISTPNTHGTGCTLSSAIASFLALKNNLPVAVKKAIKYVNEAIKYGREYKTGKGNGPVNHFCKCNALFI